MDTFTIG